MKTLIPLRKFEGISAIEKMSNKKVIEKNLEQMELCEYGGMTALLNEESMGGSAGTYKNMPCSGANFAYDRKTGEILFFEVPQRLPEEFRNCSVGLFRIARYFSRDLNAGKSKQIIIGAFYSCDSKRARKNLKETIKRYNQEKWFNAPK